VLELGTPGPGPWACMVLAGLGASVLRVAQPGPVRLIPGQDVLTRDRTRLQLDLKDPEDRAHALSLVDRADVLVEGFRPGVTERLGLGPDVCLERNPRLVYARMTGWGQDGPMARLAGHDLNYLAVTGALTAMVDEASAASYPLAAALTFGGGSMFLVTGIIAALYEREHSGQGQVVDAAIADGMSMLLASAYGMLDGAGPPLTPAAARSSAPFYTTYYCADGERIAVAAAECDSWRALVEVLGIADDGARDEPGRWDELRSALEREFGRRTRAEWIARFEGVDAAITPVLRMAEAPHHPQATARGMFTTLNGHVQPTTAPRFSRTQSATPTWEPAGGSAWDERPTADIRTAVYEEGQT
jgi:alpha-methylacyl-CoA racemase